MDIAVLGSSGTYGFKVSHNSTWPYRLEQLCRSRHFETTIHNYASPGLPIGAYAERIVYIEQNIHPGLYIIQLPVFSRTYIGVNGTGRLKEANYRPVANPYCHQ
jgi:hypothetical protein